MLQKIKAVLDFETIKSGTPWNVDDSFSFFMNSEFEPTGWNEIVQVLTGLDYFLMSDETGDFERTDKEFKWQTEEEFFKEVIELLPKTMCPPQLIGSLIFCFNLNPTYAIKASFYRRELLYPDLEPLVSSSKAVQKHLKLQAKMMENILRLTWQTVLKGAKSNFTQELIEKYTEEARQIGHEAPSLEFYAEGDKAAVFLKRVFEIFFYLKD